MATLRTHPVLPAVVALFGVACTTSNVPVAQDPELNAAAPGAVTATAFGKGMLNTGTTTQVTFIFDAELTNEQAVSGYFRFHGALPDGNVDLAGDVLCLAIDRPRGRAWIAGTLNANRSTDGSTFAPAALPVGSGIHFAVEDASSMPVSRITLPRATTTPATACRNRVFPAAGLYRIEGGTAAVFP